MEVIAALAVAVAAGAVAVALQEHPEDDPEPSAERRCPLCGGPLVRGRPWPHSSLRWHSCARCGRHATADTVGLMAHTESMADVSARRLMLFERLERAGIDFSRGSPWVATDCPTTDGLEKLAERLEEDDG